MFSKATLYIFLLTLTVISQAAPPIDFTVPVTIRDFSPDTNPDFETSQKGLDPGIVENKLDSSRKPVYKGGNFQSTHGKEYFDQWFHDSPTTPKTSFDLTFVSLGNGVYSYSNKLFFPIDLLLLGNEGRQHNYHFTAEIKAKFVYQTGQTFSFIGNDDCWVFINNQLAIDVGGIHGAIKQSVDFASLNLTPGKTYNIDIFYAQRHTAEANFTIETSIELMKDPCIKTKLSR